MLIFSSPFLLKIAVILAVILLLKIAIRKYISANKLIAKYKMALTDIDFLLSLEDIHCRNNKEHSGVTYKNKFRKYVSVETGKKWSGNFTKSKISKELDKISKLEDLTIKPAISIQKTLTLNVLK